MSKKKKIILFIFSIIFLTALFTVLGISFLKKDDGKVKDLILSTDNICLEVGETINLNNYYTLSPVKSKARVLCLIENSSYAQISNNNILTTKLVGSTKIFFKVSDGNELSIEKSINLTILEKSVIPISLSFEKDVVNLGLQTNSVKNMLTINGEYNVNPIIEYSVNNVCEYNVLTGEIIPKSLGTTAVIVKFSLKGNTISASFVVNVKEVFRTIEISNLSKQEDYYIYNTTNSSIDIAVIVKENNIVVNPKLKVSIDKNENETSIIQIEMCNIALQINSLGESILKIFCEDDESVYVYVKIIKE